jgi:hypothetical protein
MTNKHLLSYNIDGSEKSEIDKYHPTTPLKMCVFRFSDCYVNDFDRLTIIKIAKLLIQFGASVDDAKEYYIYI